MVGKPGRSGRPYRPPLAWPTDLTMKTKESTAAFLEDLVKLIYEDKIGERSAGAINNTVRLLADMRGWIQKVPIQIFQGPTVVQPDMKKLMKRLSLEEKISLARIVRKIERAEAEPRT